MYNRKQELYNKNKKTAYIEWYNYYDLSTHARLSTGFINYISCTIYLSVHVKCEPKNTS